jgi:acyl-coenzyme A thioesterase PaaI-like protein
MSDAGPSLQELHAPGGVCFGCGPANPKGLRLASRPEGDGLVATFVPGKHHEAFEGVLSGGIIGCLLDCHSNWTAAWTLMRAAGAAVPPSTVTADYHVRMARPTPATGPVVLRARAVEVRADRAVVEATLEADGRVCASCRGTFVAVKPGHPAYGRW